MAAYNEIKQTTNKIIIIHKCHVQSFDSSVAQRFIFNIGTVCEVLRYHCLSLNISIYDC